jgi:arginine utilization regulatory protein
VRQLRHCIEAAMNFVSDNELTISIRHLPKYLFSDTNTKLPAMAESQAHQQISDKNRHLPEEVNVFDKIEQEEKKEILNALRQCKGNVTKSAEYLGITRQTLIYRMRKYNISKK